jgi:hypothetical protein
VDEPFSISGEEITIPVGSYSTPWWKANFSTDRSRTISGSLSYRWGGYYGGDGKMYNFSIGFKPWSNLLGTVGLAYNDIDLPQGGFTNHILRSNTTYNFSTRLALMSLIQWNGNTNQVSVNVRMSYIHRPGSYIYLVFNESRAVAGIDNGILDRTIALKYNHLLNF